MPKADGTYLRMQGGHRERYVDIFKEHLLPSLLRFFDPPSKPEAGCYYTDPQ